MDRDQSEQKPGKKPGNITRFRQDKRLTVVGGLRSLALLLMLATVVYGVWAYQDDLNVDNIKRLLSYARAATQDSDGFASYSFEPGQDTVYAPFELGLAVVSSDSYRFVTGFGAAGFSAQLRYTSPALCVSDRQVLIYDRGNTGYCVVNGYSVLHSGAGDSPIIAATMNSQGDYMLVLEESGYRNGVHIYDAKNRETCVWQTPDYYIMLPSLSPDGSRFAVQCLSEAGGVFKSQVRGYDIGNETPVFSLDFGQRQVYSVRHDKTGNLFILCEDGLYVYDDQGAPLGSYPFTGLLRFAHHEGDLPMVALRVASSSGEKVRLVAFDETGGVSLETQVTGSLRDLDYRGGCAMALFYSSVTIADLRGEAPEVWEQSAQGVRRVLCTQGGQGILVYSNRAEGIPLAQTQ